MNYDIKFLVFFYKTWSSNIINHLGGCLVCINVFKVSATQVMEIFVMTTMALISKKSFS